MAIGVFLFAVFESRLPQISTAQNVVSNVTFILLINLNILLLLLFVFLVGRNLVKLLLERRRRILGSHLRTRLVLAFVGLSLFPALLLFLVSTSFVRSSIEKWFDVQVERSLEGSDEIVRAYYRDAADEVSFYARAVAGGIMRDHGRALDDAAELEALLRARQQAGRLGTLAIYSPGAELIAAAWSPAQHDGLTVSPSAEEILRLRTGEVVTAVLPVGERELVRAMVPLQVGGELQGIVAVDRIIPAPLAQGATDITRSFAEYRELKILKQPIKNTYVLTLTLITLIVVFAATWYGLALAKGITVPIRLLAEGTREVAQGNLDVKIEGAGKDEVGLLVGAFNQMTRDLKEVNGELEDRRRHMETVLGNIRAGVVSVSPSGTVTTWNAAAERLLGISSRQAHGRLLEEVLDAPSLEPVRTMIDELLATGRAQGERQVEVVQDEDVFTLLVAAAPLSDPTHVGHSAGAVLVFEDITQILKVQRMEAWREVAQRIAHEIKNPLTPIQLSAQRLQRKYGTVVDEEIFDECTRTIVRQVDDLKSLVDEFSRFARLPSGNQVPQNLNGIVEEALTLFREAHPEICFEVHFAPDLPDLLLDREGIRRALINMLDNAVAACVGVEGQAARIAITTEFLQSLRVVRLEVADNGIGMSPDIRARLFEPYFSTKREGTGLGLAIVSAIFSEHRALVRVRDNDPVGSRFIVEFPVGDGPDA